MSKEELQVVLSSWKQDKILRSYYWLVMFYIGFYYLLENDFIRVINEVIRSSKVLGPFNANFWALIPKKDNLMSFEECFKRAIFSEGISTDHFGFLEGKQIHDAIGETLKGIHSMKQKERLVGVMKLSLFKAYGIYRWLYIRLFFCIFDFSYL